VRRSAVLAISTLGVVAGGIVGSVALATPAAAATAPAPTKIATNTYIRANSASVTQYDQVGLWGRVLYNSGRRAVIDQPVQLQLHSGTTWRTVAFASADRTGYVRYAVTPTRTGTYRMYYAGHKGFSSSLSGNLLVTVKPATRASRVLAVAASKVGDWYSFGSAGPTTFDCSGLTLYAYRSVGVSLPHNANAQLGYGRAETRAQAHPGDLMIFVSGGFGYHAAIYAGNGYMYDAPHPGATVGRHKISSSNVVFRRLV
jgi:cell wall-associated NlpC family hydrolase